MVGGSSRRTPDGTPGPSRVAEKSKGARGRDARNAGSVPPFPPGSVVSRMVFVGSSGTGRRRPVFSKGCGNRREIEELRIVSPEFPEFRATPRVGPGRENWSCISFSFSRRTPQLLRLLCQHNLPDNASVVSSEPCEVSAAREAPPSNVSSVPEETIAPSLHTRRHQSLEAASCQVIDADGRVRSAAV